VLWHPLQQLRALDSEALVLGFGVLRVNLRQICQCVCVGCLEQQPHVSFHRPTHAHRAIDVTFRNRPQLAWFERFERKEGVLSGEEAVEITKPMVVLTELHDLIFTALDGSIGVQQSLLDEERFVARSPLRDERLPFFDRREREEGLDAAPVVLSHRDALSDLVEDNVGHSADKSNSRDSLGPNVLAAAMPLWVIIGIPSVFRNDSRARRVTQWARVEALLAIASPCSCSFRIGCDARRVHSGMSNRRD